MRKVNLENLKKNKFFNCFESVVDNVWNEKNIPCTFHMDCEIDDYQGFDFEGFKKFIKNNIHAAEEKVNFINNNKEKIGKVIMTDNFLADIDETDIPEMFVYEKPFKGNKKQNFLYLLEQWIKCKGKEYEDQGNVFYITYWKTKVDFPITEEQFINSMNIHDFEFLFDRNGSVKVTFEVEFFPDYFNALRLAICLDEKNNLKIVDIVDFDLDENNEDLEEDFFDDENEKDFKSLYEYILTLSSSDIKEMVENSETEDEKTFYLELEELIRNFGKKN